MNATRRDVLVDFFLSSDADECGQKWQKDEELRYVAVEEDSCHAATILVNRFWKSQQTVFPPLVKHVSIPVC